MSSLKNEYPKEKILYILVHDVLITQLRHGEKVLGWSKKGYFLDYDRTETRESEAKRVDPQSKVMVLSVMQNSSECGSTEQYEVSRKTFLS